MIFCYTVILIRCLFPLQVKTNGPKHTCSSVNQCGDTMASNNWVAERVVEFLKEDSTVGPTELQHKLKDKDALEVPYNKVLRGKEKAPEMIFGKWDDSYDLLPTYRTELLKSVPGSIVELDNENH